MTLVIIAVTIIVWFLPRTEGHMYHYDINRPWMYGQLIAKFDFPIFKTEEVFKAEQDSIRAHFRPYFQKKSHVEQLQIARFRNDYAGGIPGLSPDYVNIIAQRLQLVYNKGIMDPVRYNELRKDTASSIRLVDGKEVSDVALGTLLSTTAAYEMLFASEQMIKNRNILQQCDLNEYIEPNVVYDAERSETDLSDQLSTIAAASGWVQEGQRIIDRGDIVDEATYQKLNSFEQAMEKHNNSDEEKLLTIIGQSLYVLILVMLFTIYLSLYHKEYFAKPRSLIMLFFMIVLFPVMTSLMMEFNKFSVYIIPFAMAPIFMRVFTDSRTAFNAHVAMVLICAVAVKYQYEFIIVQIVAGLIAIYSLRELEKRSQIFLTAILVTLGSAAVYLSLQLIQSDDFSKLDQTIYYHFAANGFFLLFSYPLMLVIEKAFGFISTVTMFELSNSNNPLLRKLSQVAPGTFQHSIMVGNLAAEVAHKINAGGQLVRTGALYHDIGKMKNPAFFTENQAAGVNPHDNISEIDSAKIITAHVTEGLKLAEEHNLPTVIKDFIRTHHGTGMAKYFYINYKNSHPDEDVDPEPFSYKGPNPETREQAILMMCDAVEAASRSLREYTADSISEMVNRIIDTQVKEGYFTECPITFHDISRAKQILIERLKNIYHTRIQYPEQTAKN
jgi:putative nucleotidyltransferase with HDIG domain